MLGLPERSPANIANTAAGCLDSDGDTSDIFHEGPCPESRVRAAAAFSRSVSFELAAETV